VDLVDLMDLVDLTCAGHDVDGAGTCPGSRCVDRSDVGSGTYCGVVVDSAGCEGTTSIR